MRKTRVLITVDTEAFVRGYFSIDAAVYGKIDGERYGVEKIMDMGERYGYRITFFVDTTGHHLFGKPAMAALCRLIAQRGHDVQLHLHPNNVPGCIYPLMSHYPLATQGAMIREGKELIGDWTGKAPLAFRAGSYGADLRTIEALEKNGFKIDSSYFTFHKNCALSRQLNNKYKNIVFTINSIIEVPVTVYKLFDSIFYENYSKIDINACAKEEIYHVINKLAGRTDVLVLFLHSFSFLKWSLRDRYVRPNPYVMEKFDCVLKFLSRRGDIEITTVREYYDAVLPRDTPGNPVDFIPASNLFLNFNRLAMRYIMQ